MLALVRPDSWNLPLFLHVLGAIILVGTTATLAIAGFAARRRDGHEQLLSSTIARVFVLGALPSWILMRVGAEWIRSKEFTGGADEPGWVGVGYIVSDGTAVLLIVTGSWPRCRFAAARAARAAAARDRLRARLRGRLVCDER
jgi:hypothetical protein